MASKIPTKAVEIHNALALHLKKHIVGTELQDLKQLFSDNPLTPHDIESINNIYDLFHCLMREKTIDVGNYEQLVQKLQQINPNLVGYVKDKEKEIKQILYGGPSPVKQPRTEDQSTEIHPDLQPLIDTTKAKIKVEKEERKFFTTKGFRDAKVKLLQKKVVIIKGNTGDGKTAIAIQLIHWLNQEKQDLQPLEIPKIKKLDLLAPNLKLITFIDDIFGEKDMCQKEVCEWNKRISVLKTRFVDEEATNFLVITIRNEVFNSLKTGSRKIILTDDHTIDLSSNTYKIEEEKKGLLELYKPKEFSWSDEEKDQIVTFAPNIGFPQCCQLFYKSVDLQKERVEFFKSPFDFLNEALSKLPEYSALLYLFFNDGMIKVKHLDPNGQNVNKELLNQAFNINLIPGEDDSTKLTDEKKVTFVKESLKKLSGFLVMTRKLWSGEDVYRFHHDSIYVAVALLYGNETPVGYIQNCPSKCLSYLTTSETATNMIVISSDHYKAMCERVLREFVCEEWCEASVGSLDVWKDPVFVKKFVGLLNERKIDKLDVLNRACWSGAEECALYLLSEGVKPDEDTAWSLVGRHWNDGNRQLCLLKEIVVYLNYKTKLGVLCGACESGAEECASYLLSEGVKPDEDTDLGLLVGGSWNDASDRLLKKMVVYMNDETKLGMLNVACESGAEECALYLLSEGVKPDQDTAWSLVSNRHWNDGNKQLCLLKEIVGYLNDETKLGMLNVACWSGAEECALCLLSEGVKPDKDTNFGSLVDRHRNDDNKLLCLLKKIVVYMNDETKLDVLNGACKSGAEECALYLLSEGVKPDKYTALSLVSGYWNDGNKRLCLLKEIVVYMNDETKLDLLNKACMFGAEECALYLLCEERVKPDKDTVLYVVRGGSIALLRKLLEYDVTPTARSGLYDGNVLHVACRCGREEMATLLCDTYPHLVLDTDGIGQTPLHVVAEEGSVGLFQTMERFVLNSLYRVENQQTKCESVDGCVVHKYCVCAQYMSQLVDGGRSTVLHLSCGGGWFGGEVNREVCLYLCRSYPGLTPIVDREGRHCLHHIAEQTSDVDLFTECETYVKQYVESTGRKYDVTTILTNYGESVLDKAKEWFWGSENNRLLEHLGKVFGK